MDLDNDLDKIIEDIMKRYVDSKVKEAFEIMLKLWNNIIKNPTEEKFRIFKKTNEVIKTKVLVMKEFTKLMIAVGYSDLDKDAMMFLEEDHVKLKKGIEAINKSMKILLEKEKEQEKLDEIKKQDEIKRHGENIKRKFKEEKEIQNKIKAQLECDKEERKKVDKPNTSYSKPLKYGANVCKFEPTNTGGGGGGG